MALTANQMLMALHKANPATLKQRFNPQQLQAAYAKLGASKPTPSGNTGAQPPPGTPTQPPGSAPASTGDFTNVENPTTVAGGLNANEQVANTSAQKNIALNNPDTQGPFSSTTTTVDANGNPTQSTSLSQGNQNVVNGVQQAAQSANTGANSAIGGITSSLDPNNPNYGGNSAFVNATYAQLTHGNADQKARDQAALNQSLADKGITIGSQQYDDQQKQLNDRYDQMDQSAHAQAIQQGTTTGLGAAQTLSGIGQGGFYSNSQVGAPQYQGVNYQLPGATDVAAQQAATAQGQQGLNIQKQQANTAQQVANASINKLNRGSARRTSSAPQAPSAFES